jgi:para-nitrobenzyl esterase
MTSLRADLALALSATLLLSPGLPATALPTVGEATAVAAPRVQVEAGGLIGTTTSDSQVSVFKGIPFASPPVGPRRWRLPGPVAHWPGYRHAVAFAPSCPQPSIPGASPPSRTSEDCLYLNIWAPKHPTNEVLPVMVWIHGGGFLFGSSAEPVYDGLNLALHGVVVVTFDYRLGVLGFLTPPGVVDDAGGARGNYGLADQIAALQWVHRNIAGFGGDPRNVTVFGESAGSIALSSLMASPEARGLFSRAIGESGAEFTLSERTLHLRPAADVARETAAWATSLHAPSLTALRGVSVGELLQAAARAPQLFQPVIDGRIIPADLYTLYGRHEQMQLPLLVGWNQHEATYFIRAFRLAVPATAEAFRDSVQARFGTEAQSVLDVYPAHTEREARSSYYSLVADEYMGFPIRAWAKQHAQSSAVFAYEFDRAPGSGLNGTTPSDTSPTHGDELEYVFGTLPPDASAADRAVSNQIMQYWTNFARNGDPNGGNLPRWPRYSSDALLVMHLDQIAEPKLDENDGRAGLLQRVLQSHRD